MSRHDWAQGPPRPCFSCGQPCTGEVRSLRPVRFDWCGGEPCRDAIDGVNLHTMDAMPATGPATLQQQTGVGDVEVWPLVLADIEERRAFGLRKYGVPLRTNDGRDTLVDAYQESLDQTVYLRKLIAERDQAAGRDPQGERR